MRMSPATLLAVLLLPAMPGAGMAQQMDEGAVATVVRSGGETQTPRPTLPREPRRGPSFLRVFAYGTGGTLLGGWTGFMTSQVIWSDWLGQRHTGELGTRRMQFTVTGAAVGALVGTILGFRGNPHGAPPAPPGLLVRQGSITTDEIRAASAHDAAEAVRLLRPAWLTRKRGNDVVRIDVASIDTTLQGRVPPFEAEGIRAYLDDSLLGGLDELAGIPADQIDHIEWWDPRSAMLRWGAGHTHGAIRIVTNPGTP